MHANMSPIKNHNLFGKKKLRLDDMHVYGGASIEQLVRYRTFDSSETFLQLKQTCLIIICHTSSRNCEKRFLINVRRKLMCKCNVNPVMKCF